MEIEGAKTAVFGVGGAGCKILQELSKRVPGNMERIALDTDKAELDALGEGVQKVVLGESLASCTSFEETKKALKEEMRAIEDSLAGASMAIVVAGLGGKTGTCIGDFLADLCDQKGIFVLFIPIYPLNKIKGGPERADAAIRRMRDKVDGVVIVDNNLKREEGNLPMLSVFRQVNAVVAELVTILITSISSMGYMNLSRDELRHFFHGDLFFILTSGVGRGVEEARNKALEEVGKCADLSGIRKVLVMLSSPMEVSIAEMRGLNGVIEERLRPEAIKWINIHSKSGETRMLLVSAVEKLPLIEGLPLPGKVEAPAGEDAVSDFFERMPKSPETLSERPEKLRSPALMGLSKEAQKKPEEPETKKEPEKKPEELEEPEEEEVDLDDVVNELVGFPSFKKKGQKKLGDYRGDQYGIDYI